MSDDVASYIVKLIEEAPGKQLSGAVIAPLVRAQFPDLQHQKLKTFIANSVSGVVPVGSKGLDPVYGLASETAQQDANNSGATHATAISVWRTFARSGELYKLYVHQGSGHFAVVPPSGDELDAPWVKIPPCDSEKQRTFARDFADTLTPRLGEALRKYADEDTEAWWKDYYAAAKNMNLASRWNRFRYSRLKDALTEKLNQLGLPTEGIPALPTAGSPARSETGFDHKDRDLQTFAAQILSRMSNSDLRDIKVRLGDVFDAIRRPR